MIDRHSPERSDNIAVRVLADGEAPVCDPPGTIPAMAMSPRALWWVLKQAFVGWWNDNVPRLGASLAFYMLFALSPMLVIAISVAGLVFSSEVVQGEIVGQMQGLVGQKGAAVVQVILEGASKPSTSIRATAIGAVTAFFGATGAFIEMQTAFNAIWRVTPRPSVGVKELLLQRLISFGLVVGMGSIMLVSLLVTVALAGLNRYLSSRLPPHAALWEAANVLVSLGIITLLLAMVYKVLPDVRRRWHDVWVGALVTAGFFTIGKQVIGLYLGTRTIASSYGAVGGRVADLGVLLGASRADRRRVHPVLRRAVSGRAAADEVRRPRAGATSASSGRHRFARPMRRAASGGV